MPAMQLALQSAVRPGVILIACRAIGSLRPRLGQPRVVLNVDLQRGLTGIGRGA